MRSINNACDRFLREREPGYAAKQDANKAAGYRGGNFQIKRKNTLPPRECENGKPKASPADSGTDGAGQKKRRSGAHGVPKPRTRPS